MGTSGAYTGSGGSDGKAIRDAVGDFLDAISDQADQDQADANNDGQHLDPQAVRPILNLLQPASSRGSGTGGIGSGVGGVRQSDGATGGSRSGGGPQRSIARSARTAGRAAAAALAYRTGDAQTLELLGLDYNELQGLGDQFEVLRRIVDMACGTPDSTIEDHEQRLVAAGVAEWVLDLEDSGYIPTPDEVVRHTIALVIAEALLSESGNLINSSDNATMAEQEIRDVAEVLASQAQLSVNGATEHEIALAIESGIETLLGIHGGSS